jgi:hypothetical protein
MVNGSVLEFPHGVWVVRIEVPDMPVPDNLVQEFMQSRGLHEVYRRFVTELRGCPTGPLGAYRLEDAWALHQRFAPQFQEKSIDVHVCESGFDDGADLRKTSPRMHRTRSEALKAATLRASSGLVSRWVVFVVQEEAPKDFEVQHKVPELPQEYSHPARTESVMSSGKCRSAMKAFDTPKSSASLGATGSESTRGRRSVVAFQHDAETQEVPVTPPNPRSAASKSKPRGSSEDEECVVS